MRAWRKRWPRRSWPRLKGPTSTQCTNAVSVSSTALIAGVEQRDLLGFQETLADLLRETAAEGDDTHVWQAAISHLGSELPALFATWGQPATRDLARELLDQARVAISAATLRQRQQFVVDQSWTDGRIGLLTARLLTALDETQVYQILAQHLPEMGIRTAAVALFEAEGEDPVAWSSSAHRHLRAAQPTYRFRTRDYPPAGLGASEQPFSQALLPLVNPRGQLGYVAFDTTHLELYGAIAQQIAGALNTAQLYREATEGRRLAEEANRMKSRFLSTVSHELRTPLNLIVGSERDPAAGQRARADAPLPASGTRTDIERIYANAQHLGWLIGDVLDLASSDAGQLRLTNEFVDLGQALQTVAETGRQLAADKGLAWHADLPGVGALGVGRPHAPAAGGAQPHQQRGQIHGARRSQPAAGGRREVRHGQRVATPAWASRPRSRARSSTSFAGRSGASPRATAGWAWDWRSAGASSSCTAARSVCIPPARKAPARPSTFTLPTVQPPAQARSNTDSCAAAPLHRLCWC